jgi:hypothetical protein
VLLLSDRDSDVASSDALAVLRWSWCKKCLIANRDAAQVLVRLFSRVVRICNLILSSKRNHYFITNHGGLE